MAVAADTTAREGTYGPIEAVTLPVLRAELEKLQGTLSDDRSMGYEKCLSICNDFIDELGQCINLSIDAHPEDQVHYDGVFRGLQDVINLMHGTKAGLNDSNGYPRLMDHDESRLAAGDCLTEIMEDLMSEIGKREKMTMIKKRPAMIPKDGSPS